jgi:cytidylate kinase
MAQVAREQRYECPWLIYPGARREHDAPIKSIDEPTNLSNPGETIMAAITTLGVAHPARSALTVPAVESAVTLIALTQETGSRGAEIADGVAKKLGLKIIDAEMVAKNVARRLGVAEDAVLRHFNGSPSLLDRWLVDSRKLIHYTAEEILRHAQQRKALIQGWGAATLLRDIPQIISVHVCAPIDYRVRVMMEQLGSNDAEAMREEIERFDAAHARAMRTLFGVEREDSHPYHIVLNTERMAVEGCVKAVCKLAQSPRFRDHGTTSSARDKLLEAKLNAAFAEKISVSMAPLGVSVAVADGKITLEGITTSGSLRRRAEAIAREATGIVVIDNPIHSVPSRGRLR